MNEKTVLTEKIKIYGEEFKFSTKNVHKIYRIFKKIMLIINDTGFGTIQFTIENKEITVIKRSDTEL